MKTLANPRDKQEIVKRLQSVQPSSQRRWGKMTAHQMICHLCDGCRMYIGERPVQPAHLHLPRVLMRWVAIWLPLKWPHGFPAVPELNQQVDGTKPLEFEDDKRELNRLLDRLTRRPMDFSWQLHPHFGQMSEREWMRLAYLHADHHLRQFGA